MHKADQIQQGYFTQDQLNTQLALCKGQLHCALAELDCVLKPTWQMAIDYGEEVRHAHIDTNKRRIDYLERRIVAIKLAKPKID